MSAVLIKVGIDLSSMLSKIVREMSAVLIEVGIDLIELAYCI